LAQEKIRLLRQQQRMRALFDQRIQYAGHQQHRLQEQLVRGVTAVPQRAQEALARAQLRLQSVDPKVVLKRGYAWLTNRQGHALTNVAQFEKGQAVEATLVDGRVDLAVTQTKLD
jgi:exodeoxyribonuclease VII large subunit